MSMALDPAGDMKIVVADAPGNEINGVVPFAATHRRGGCRHDDADASDPTTIPTG
jgi:hypothetical protein